MTFLVNDRAKTRRKMNVQTLTPPQSFVVMELYKLGRGRMTQWTIVHRDPRTERVLIRDGWLCRDGLKVGLTELGWQAMHNRFGR